MTTTTRPPASMDTVANIIETIRDMQASGEIVTIYSLRKRCHKGPEMVQRVLGWIGRQGWYRWHLQPVPTERDLLESIPDDDDYRQRFAWRVAVAMTWKRCTGGAHLDAATATALFGKDG